MAMLRRSSITCYSNKNDIESHRVRIVLAEKAVSAEVIFINKDDPDEEFLQLNPQADLPAMVDRDLVLNQSNIIMEYLDERFPHPPLLPIYPIARAKSRLMIHRIERDWYTLADNINKGVNAAESRKQLTNQLVQLMPAFKKLSYFMSSEFSLVDCCVAPLLWRLGKYGIHFNEKEHQPILAYMHRVFERNSFQVSLTDEELIERESVDDIN